MRSDHTGGSVVSYLEGMLEPMLTDGLEWHRSSRCNGGACVEVAARADLVFVRNSADPSGSVLVLGRARWTRLISRVKELRVPGS
jgi:Domain of unknown function (DUF397)